jgi:hypothetical protein
MKGKLLISVARNGRVLVTYTCCFRFAAMEHEYSSTYKVNDELHI